MLAGDHGALDHEHVEARLHGDLVVAQDTLRCQRGRHHHLLLLDFAYPLGDQLGLDGLPVDLLHLPGGLVLGQRRDPLELGLGILVACEDALEVQHRQPADPGQGFRG